MKLGIKRVIVYNCARQVYVMVVSPCLEPMLPGVQAHRCLAGSAGGPQALPPLPSQPQVGALPPIQLGQKMCCIICGVSGEAIAPQCHCSMPCTSQTQSHPARLFEVYG